MRAALGPHARQGARQWHARAHSARRLDLLALGSPLQDAHPARFAGAAAASIALPTIGLGQLACVVVFFLGGYFLYSSIFAAIGAANDSERDAQQAQMPVMMVLIVASMCFPIVSGAPRDPLAVVLTTIPFFSPVLMPMRVLITPVPAWEIALSLVTLLATIALACGARRESSAWASSCTASARRSASSCAGSAKADRLSPRHAPVRDRHRRLRSRPRRRLLQVVPPRPASRARRPRSPRVRPPGGGAHHVEAHRPLRHREGRPRRHAARPRIGALRVERQVDLRRPAMAALADPALPKADVVFLTDIHPGSPRSCRARAAPQGRHARRRSAGRCRQDPRRRRDEERRHAGRWPASSPTAVPMYNLMRGPAPGKLYHDKGRGNGYVLDFGGAARLPLRRHRVHPGDEGARDASTSPSCA